MVMVGFWIFVAIVLMFLGLFIFTQGGQNLGPAIVTIGVVILLIFILTPARARDLYGRYAASPLKGWFDSLKSGKGPCCSDADGSAVADVDWESNAGRYRVRIEGRWWDVPDDAVITEPNRDGRTMVWPIIYRSLGVLERIDIRCFMPGAMTQAVRDKRIRNSDNRFGESVKPWARTSTRSSATPAQRRRLIGHSRHWPTASRSPKITAR